MACWHCRSCRPPLVDCATDEDDIVWCVQFLALCSKLGEAKIWKSILKKAVICLWVSRSEDYSILLLHLKCCAFIVGQKPFEDRQEELANR